ncbi:MAG: UDP-2,3-diacylglucosamine diphosphatase [Deltaproteobacteria bacterium]|nr:MAG: UDP-2,3-diacylglucosamine diphosphatase [Deltaproteobacteria bacterium]
MRAVFLADAHLRRPDDDNYRALLSFLADQEGRTDLLVLLGDICEFLVGYPDSVFPPYVPLFEALARLQHGGTQLVYVEGNHDFHLEAGFRNRFPCRVLPDGGVIDLDGRRVLVVHGDLANPADRGYRLLRAILRSAAVRLLIRLLPAAWTWAIAERMSRASRRTGNDKSRRWPARDILIPYAETQLAADVRAVVTGHFHQPLHEQLAGGELIALGDWITRYSYAVWEDGAFRLECYHPARRS